MAANPAHQWIIDTDAGIDDAVALLVALSQPGVHTLGITAVAGNVGVDQAVTNVCLTLDQLGSDVPVYRGCDRPLWEPQPERSTGLMGSDGLGEASYHLPASQRRAQPEPAAAALVRLIRQADPAQPLTLLAIGPLTNLALAIRMAPDLPQRVARLVIMGGAVQANGNTSAAAEFNLRCDPEAADIVVQAPFAETWLVPWETTLRSPFDWEACRALSALKTPQAVFFDQITALLAEKMRAFGFPGLLLPDLLAAAVALDPGLVRTETCASVQVDTGWSAGRGLTAVDWQNRLGLPSKIHVVTAVDSEAILALLAAALRKPS